METLKPYQAEDLRSKNVKARLGATALEIRQFLAQSEDEAKADVQAAEEYHDQFNHIPDPETPEYFTDWQKECYETIKKKHNVVLSAPTGSGKTSVFMEWAKEKQREAAKEGTRSTVYITAPIKALSNQRFRELEQQGYKVGLETGDVKNIPDDADIICCTQEIFTNKYCEDDSATLVVDELHYMFENPDRQRAYIDGLHNTKAKNVLTCSATMGDLSKTVGFINKVSNRDFAGYETEERLTDLTYEGEIEPGEIKNAFVVAFSINKILGINKRLCDERAAAREEHLDSLSDTERASAQEKYAEAEAKIEKIAEKYQVDPQIGMEYGVANYYGRMLPKEKLFVEELFEKGLIDTVIGTDALAMGVNFPIENVVFTQLMKYQGRGLMPKRLTKNLFDQLCGRAGRKDYFDHGHVYYATSFRDTNGYPTEERYREYIPGEENSYDGRGYYEWVRYDTGEIFEDLQYEENEDASVALTGDVRTLLSGERSIEDEVAYVANLSTEYTEHDISHIQGELERTLEQIRNYRVDPDFPEYDDEFQAGIAAVYDDTISCAKNCSLFARIIRDGHSKDTDGQRLSTNDLFQVYAEHPDNFNELLQFRKYLHSLPSKYRKMYDLAGLDNTINSIDATALNAWSGQLNVSEIDGLDEPPDIELLMTIYDFDDIEDEVYTAIREGSISAEKVFSRLTGWEQWDHFETFRDEFGCDIDINSVIQLMYDEASDIDELREIDWAVEDKFNKGKDVA